MSEPFGTRESNTHVVIEKVPNYGRCCELPSAEDYPMGTVVRCAHGKRWITDVEGMVFGASYWRRKLLPW